MWWRTARCACLLLPEGLGGAAADALENATLHGQEYLSIEELQQASGVGSSIIDRLRQVGALGDLPESSQVSFFLTKLHRALAHTVCRKRRAVFFFCPPGRGRVFCISGPTKSKQIK